VRVRVRVRVYVCVRVDVCVCVSACVVIAWCCEILLRANNDAYVAYICYLLVVECVRGAVYTVCVLRNCEFILIGFECYACTMTCIL
jgi:hypothetical protein